MAANRRKPGVHLALLRGINLGSKNKLPMKELAAIFTEAGCERVRTYIQSGNVLFAAAATLAERVPSLVTAAIEDRFGYRVPVVTRSADELGRAARRHPLDGPRVDSKALHVAFLERRPTRAKVSALDPDRSPPDTFEVRGREVYLCCPNGLARTKLSNDWLDRELGTVSTVRSWRTVQKLLELARDH